MKSYFVTGTGTDVGKTYVSAFLLKMAQACGKQAGYWKPIQCGSASFQGELYEKGDAEFINKKLLPGQKTLNSVYLKEACSPHLAYELEGKEFDRDQLLAKWQEIQSSEDDLSIVEGAGGVLVPLSSQYTIRDWIHNLQTPVILVAHPSLGTLNHTLLSLEALSKLQVAQVVFSYDASAPTWMESDNKKTLIEVSQGQIDAIPSIPSWEEWSTWSQDDCLKYLSNNPSLMSLF